MSQIDLNSLQNNENDEQNQQVIPTTSNTAGSGRVAASSSGLPKSQGSGRFTNLQKYISANSGAGTQVANKLSNATNRDVNQFNEGFASKSSELNKGINDAKDLFNNQGEAFKTQLGGYQQGLNTFNNITDRGNFDQAGNQITAFTKDPNFGTFQNLQKGLGLNETQLKQTADATNEMYKNTYKNINDKINNIQTEKGRYDLLQDATPTFGQRTTSGGNRLNQLFFQKDQGAVSNLQNKFKADQDAISQKSAELGLINNSLNDVTAQELDLQNNLTNQSKELQNIFYNKLNTDQNKQIVNDARSDIYNDYVTNLSSGNITQDLKSLLNLDGVSTYNTVGNLPTTYDGNVIQKVGALSPAPPPPVAQALPGNFSTYNLVNSPDKAKQYLQKSGQTASTFQDLLSQADYDAYNSIGKLFGEQQVNATGKSNLNPAVLTSGNLRQDILNRDADYQANYANKNYITQGRAIVDDPNSPHNRVTTSNVTPEAITGYDDLISRLGYVGDYQNHDERTYGNLNVTNTAANLDDYIRNENPNNFINNSMIVKDEGNTDDRAAALALSRGGANSEMTNLLNSIINETGIKQRATLSADDTVQQNETYQKLKALGLL